MDAEKRKQLRELIGIYPAIDDLYSRAGGWMGLRYPAVEDLMEEVWVEIADGERCPRNQKGFDARVPRIQPEFMDQVKEVTILDERGHVVIHGLAAKPGEPPAYDRLIVAAVGVPFHISYAVMMSYDYVQKLVAKTKTKALSMSRCWTEREGVTNLTVEFRAVLADLMGLGWNPDV